MLNWPAYSPNLIPTENVRNIMLRGTAYVSGKQRTFCYLEQLRIANTTAWTPNEHVVINNLFLTILRNFQIICCNGKVTDY